MFHRTMEILHGEEDIDVAERNVQVQIDGWMTEQQMMRWRPTALALVLVTLLEAMLLCLVIFWRPSS